RRRLQVHQASIARFHVMEHPEAVRQRWMMTALVSLLDEDNGESLHADRQGLESMMGVMMSYRQIIHQMDTLLSQASATADRLLPLADEREDEPDE
ncbi:unnamed protein product, partial [Effrenium voratum]